VPQNNDEVVRESAHRRRLFRWIVPAVVLGAIAAIVVVAVHDGQSSGDQATLAARRAAVELRGEHVMPFDQNATVHHFSHTIAGGVETVTTNDPHNAKQIRLVQQHLAHERDLFAVGDFSDPMAIHGMKMPGVQDLQRGAAAGRLTIEYKKLNDGAQLTYRATEPALVKALHSWFDAQLMDHGSHATVGNP